MSVEINDNFINLSLDSSSAIIYYYGATITNLTLNNNNILYLSNNTLKSPQIKAIRGGIPIVFPQFGPGTLPQHGFARVSTWEFTGILEQQPQLLQVSFSLTPDRIPESQRELFPFDFELCFIVTLSPGILSTQLKIKNTGSVTWPFTCLLHTYFSTPDISNTTIHGLQDCEYLNSLNKITATEQRNSINIDSEVDSIYSNVPSELHVKSSIGNILIENTGFKDAVLWNPWIAKSKTMADFGDDDYKSMVCLELGNVKNQELLDAGKEWKATQTISFKL